MFAAGPNCSRPGRRIEKFAAHGRRIGKFAARVTQLSPQFAALPCKFVSRILIPVNFAVILLCSEQAAARLPCLANATSHNNVTLTTSGRNLVRTLIEMELVLLFEILGERQIQKYLGVAVANQLPGLAVYNLIYRRLPQKRDDVVAPRSDQTIF